MEKSPSLRTIVQSPLIPAANIDIASVIAAHPCDQHPRDALLRIRVTTFGDSSYTSISLSMWHGVGMDVSYVRVPIP